VRICFIGDIVGKPGRRAVAEHLYRIIDERLIDLTIANCENAAGGFGVTPSVVKQLFAYGIDVLTSGNHIWDKREVMDIIESETRLLRPANYPPAQPGFGHIVAETPGGVPVVVLNLSGRVFMASYDCPFRTADDLLPTLTEAARVIVVDMHAEATSEKQAMGHYLDGRVSAVIGTHTHVQTADERILSGGTAYITDVGMTGPVNSIIGVEKEAALTRFLTLQPQKLDTAGGLAQFSACIIEIDEATGRATSIERMCLSGR
jgi:metallophosphoesterase (TIGR00282 family)